MRCLSSTALRRLGLWKRRSNAPFPRSFDVPRRTRSLSSAVERPAPRSEICSSKFHSPGLSRSLFLRYPCRLVCDSAPFFPPLVSTLAGSLRSPARISPPLLRRTIRRRGRECSLRLETEAEASSTSQPCEDDDGEPLYAIRQPGFGPRPMLIGRPTRFAVTERNEGRNAMYMARTWKAGQATGEFVTLNV